MSATNVLARRFLDKASKVLGGVGRLIYLYPMEQRIGIWYSNTNHMNLRFEYDLNSSSLVFDLGGYEGQWASDIYSRFRCTIHIFEPVETYAENIRKRFAKNAQIKVHPFSLGSKDAEISIGLGNDGSSVFKKLTKQR